LHFIGLTECSFMANSLPAAPHHSSAAQGRQKRGAVLRSALLSPAERSAQARKAAQAKWARRRETEDAPTIRGKLNKLRKAREELLAAVLGNATAGAAGKPVKGKEELAAIRAGLAELRMEIPLVEARLLQVPQAPPSQPRPPMVPDPPAPMKVQHSPLGVMYAQDDYDDIHGEMAID
jgi:hypothetical protein